MQRVTLHDFYVIWQELEPIYKTLHEPTLWKMFSKGTLTVGRENYNTAITEY